MASSEPYPARVIWRRLSRTRIVDAALAIIDEDGMAAVTMRGVAARLDVEAMSLYKHIDNRDALFDAVVERIVNELSDDNQISGHPEAWKPYLAEVARGIRRYARAHSHAFPLVATRPTQAPWINPPLRSLEWIETFLRTLHEHGFSDSEVLFAYRSFNGYLLGYLLLETSARAIHDPLPGDGSYAPTGPEGSDDALAPEAAVPGALTPTRERADRRDIRDAVIRGDVIDPQGQVDASRYPTVHRLAAGLAEDHFDTEFESGLIHLLNQIEDYLGGPMT
jgi:TetR/AcrR family tetracycline transcriptional repressor